MTVVVTGAGGHVGANLIRELVNKGRRVRALIHNDQRALAGLDIEIIKGDICDPESLNRAFAGAEVVYHLAANISLLMSDWPFLEKVNVIGTRNVVNACIKSGVKRLVHFSSIHAFDVESQRKLITESCPLVDSRKCPPYNRSKAYAEREVYDGMTRGLDAVIINPTAIIGPYDYQPSHFGTVLLALANGKMPALVAGGYDWVDVRDVAAGAMRAEQIAPSGARYLLSGHKVPISEVAAIVEEITGVPAPHFICPMWLAYAGAPIVTAYNRLTGGRPLYTTVSLKALDNNRQVSHEKAAREIGYQPRPFRQTLVDTLQWFKDNDIFISPLKKAG